MGSTSCSQGRPSCCPGHLVLLKSVFKVWQRSDVWCWILPSSGFTQFVLFNSFIYQIEVQFKINVVLVKNTFRVWTNGCSSPEKGRGRSNSSTATLRRPICVLLWARSPSRRNKTGVFSVCPRVLFCLHADKPAAFVHPRARLISSLTLNRFYLRHETVWDMFVKIHIRPTGHRQEVRPC